MSFFGFTFSSDCSTMVNSCETFSQPFYVLEMFSVQNLFFPFFIIEWMKLLPPPAALQQHHHHPSSGHMLVRHHGEGVGSISSDSRSKGLTLVLFDKNVCRKKQIKHLDYDWLRITSNSCKFHHFVFFLELSQHFFVSLSISFSAYPLLPYIPFPCIDLSFSFIPLCLPPTLSFAQF